MTTTITSVAVVNSTVDSTPIGSNTPSTARFITPAGNDNSTNAATTAWCLLGFAISLGSSGYIKLPSWMGGFTLQWGSTGELPNDTPTNINFPTGFNNACLAVVATDTFALGRSAVWSAYNYSQSGFTARCDQNEATATYIALGY